MIVGGDDGGDDDEGEGEGEDTDILIHMIYFISWIYSFIRLHDE